MSYEARLAGAFEFPPFTYTYISEEKGSGSCACGKPIKNLFKIAHSSGHTITLGSECIQNYAELNHVWVAIKAKKAADKESAKAAKEVAAQKLADELMLELKALGQLAKDNGGGYISDYGIYLRVYRLKLSKKASNRVKQIQAAIDWIKLRMSTKATA